MMENLNKTLAQHSWNIVNWVTVFIVIQSLGFCYALGQNSLFSENFNSRSVCIGTIIAMIIVQILCILILQKSFAHIYDLSDEKENNTLQKILKYQKTIRILAVVLYGNFPLALLMKIKSHLLFVN